MSLNEETITEQFLLKLKKALRRDVSIVGFNKSLERVTGADWLFAFVGRDGRSQEMLVQAKRLENKERDYLKLGHSHIGADGHKSMQIDTLIAKAAEWEMPALYAFYNHLSDSKRLPSNCGQAVTSDWGISVAGAEQVLGVLPDKSFDRHRHHSMPIQCLVCSCGAAKGNLAAEAAEGVNRVVEMGDILRMGFAVDPGPLKIWEPRSKMSQVLADAMSLANTRDAGERRMLARALKSRYGVDGAVIIRQGLRQPSGLD